VNSNATATDPECAVLNRTRWTVTFRIAGVMTVVLVLVGALIYFVMLAAQRADVNRDLNWTASRSTVDSPPGCAWLVMTTGGHTVASPGTPAGFPLRADMAAVAAGQPSVQRSVTVAGNTYEVLTTHRGASVVQALYNLVFQQEDRTCLLIAIGVAELVGMVGAAVVGGLLARRSMSPLFEALGKQRRFVADASHELRTPLTRLHTRAQLLVRKSDKLGLPDGVAADLRLLVAGSRQLGDVVDDLLLATELRDSPQSTTAVDLAELVQQVAADEQPRAQLAWLTLQVHRDHGPWLVDGVPSALRRVVSALVDNAIGHTPPGGRITLTVGMAPRHRVRLTVADTGVGFPPDQADRLFERFARGSAGAGRRFGIGLALVREVVDSHGGTVTASGVPGEGAVFTVELPALATGSVPKPRSAADGSRQSHRVR
jgi:signal transduction histidine kinase